VKKIVFLTPPDARYGFSLTGVEQRVVQPSEAMEAMLKTTRDQTAGAVIIDERLVDAATQKLIAELERGWAGVVVVLPTTEKAAEAAEDYLAQLIRRAIGYQVRLSP
jgi:V/A-type H+-transporting ATPase subunit F